MADFMFVKIDGVDGASDTEGHAKWISVMSYSSGVDLPVDDSTGAARVNASPFTFSKLVDRASPRLYQMCCDGEAVKKVTVHHCRQVKGKPTPYMVFEMTDAIIASVSTSASGDELPTEEVALAYSDMEWAFVPIDKTASVGAAIKTGFDFVRCKSH